MAHGFVYLAAVMDWFSWRVLAWRVAISIEVDFCLDAVDEALARHGRPEILNTDPGTLDELNQSSQHPEGGSCDDQSKAAFGTIWAAAIVVTWSTARGRTRGTATVLGRHRVRHGK